MLYRYWRTRFERLGEKQLLQVANGRETLFAANRVYRPGMSLPVRPFNKSTCCQRVQKFHPWEHNLWRQPARHGNSGL